MKHLDFYPILTPAPPKFANPPAAAAPPAALLPPAGAAKALL